MTDFDAAFKTTNHAQWLDAALQGLRDGRTLKDLERRTLDGLTIDALYDSNPPTQHLITSNAPATTGAGWDNRLCIDATDKPDCANELILQGLQGGLTSIEVHTSEPLQLGVILQGVDLQLAPISVRSGLAYADTAQQLTDLANTAATSVAECRFSLNADPVGTSLAQGGLPLPINNALREMAEFCTKTSVDNRNYRTVLVDVAQHHNAGASPVEELHAAIATATLYVEHLLDAGMSAKHALTQINFQVALDCDMLLGIAKLRTLQLLWQHMASLFTNNKSGELSANVIAETSKRHTTHLDPWNSHLRNMIACATAAMANAQTIIIHPHATRELDLAARMARNLPIILERESGLLQVADPWAGSYAIESMTDELVRSAWKSLQQTDTSDDWLDMLQQGHWQARLNRTQARRSAMLTDEKQIMTGVNRYLSTDGLQDTIRPLNDDFPAHASFAYPMTPLQPVRDAQPFEQSNDGSTE